MGANAGPGAKALFKVGDRAWVGPMAARRSFADGGEKLAAPQAAAVRKSVRANPDVGPPRVLLILPPPPPWPRLRVGLRKHTSTMTGGCSIDQQAAIQYGFVSSLLRLDAGRESATLDRGDEGGGVQVHPDHRGRLGGKVDADGVNARASAQGGFGTCGTVRTGHALNG